MPDDDTDGDGVGDEVTASWAVAMPVMMTGASNIKNNLFKIKFS